MCFETTFVLCIKRVEGKRKGMKLKKGNFSGSWIKFPTHFILHSLFLFLSPSSLFISSLIPFDFFLSLFPLSFLLIFSLSSKLPLQLLKLRLFSSCLHSWLAHPKFSFLSHHLILWSSPLYLSGILFTRFRLKRKKQENRGTNEWKKVVFSFLNPFTLSSLSFFVLPDYTTSKRVTLSSLSLLSHSHCLSPRQLFRNKDSEKKDEMVTEKGVWG